MHTNTQSLFLLLFFSVVFLRVLRFSFCLTYPFPTNTLAFALPFCPFPCSFVSSLFILPSFSFASSLASVSLIYRPPHFLPLFRRKRRRSDRSGVVETAANCNVPRVHPSLYASLSFSLSLLLSLSSSLPIFCFSYPTIPTGGSSDGDAELCAQMVGVEEPEAQARACLLARSHCLLLLCLSCRSPSRLTVSLLLANLTHFGCSSPSPLA